MLAQKDILCSVYTTSKAESVYPLYQPVVGFNIRLPRFIKVVAVDMDPY